MDILYTDIQLRLPTLEERFERRLYELFESIDDMLVPKKAQIFLNERPALLEKAKRAATILNQCVDMKGEENHENG